MSPSRWITDAAKLRTLVKLDRSSGSVSSPSGAAPRAPRINRLPGAAAIRSAVTAPNPAVPPVITIVFTSTPKLRDSSFDTLVSYNGTVPMPGQGVGRPRDIEIDAAILLAARELLAEVGYAQVTMDATAGRAGTSKAAIYRRFNSKAELLFAAAVHRSDMALPADTGSLHGDLLALGKQIRSDMSTPSAREVAPQVIAEISRSPEVSQRLRSVFVAGERQQIDAILARAVQRGELSSLPNVATVHRMLGGALLFTIFVIDEAIDDDGLTNVIDVLTAGLRTAADA